MLARIAIDVDQVVTIVKYDTPLNIKNEIFYYYRRVVSTGVKGLTKDVIVDTEDTPIPLDKKGLLEVLGKDLQLKQDQEADVQSQVDAVNAAG